MSSLAARPLQRRLLLAGFVLASAIYVAWLGFGVQTTGDYASTFAAPMRSLLAGHLGAFFNQLPDDGTGGSLVLRAPGALLGKALFGTQLGEFRMGALECLLLLGALGLGLAARAERKYGWAGCIAAVVVCSLAPAVLDAIFFGHPEAASGAFLCVAAVLVAGTGRPRLAGIALGLAVMSKPSALVAVPPVLLAAKDRRMAAAALAAAIPTAWFATVYLVAPTAFSHMLSGLSVIAHPQELWWPLAHMRAPAGVTPAYFLPSVIAAHAREAIVVLAVVLSIPLARRKPSLRECLALLAMVSLLRCMLDPSNHIYYQLPFVIALLAWELSARPVPVVTLLSTGLIWLQFHTIAGVVSSDAQFACYMAMTLPLCVLLARESGIAQTSTPWSAAVERLRSVRYTSSHA